MIFGPFLVFANKTIQKLIQIGIPLLFIKEASPPRFLISFEFTLTHSRTMADRERERDRDRDRIRDRDRDRERRRDRDDRDRDRVRSKRSRTPERSRARHTRSRTRSPDRYRSRSLSPSRTPEDRSHRRRHHHHRSPSPESRKRQRREPTVEDEKDRQKAVSDFVEGIAKEQQKQTSNSGGEGVDEDEIEMMKKFGIPVGFDSTKGKPVPGADVSGVRAVTKRQPRQYMNRRGGFNRPLPAERNR